MPLYPRSVTSHGTYPNSSSFHCFHLRLVVESIKELRGASLSHFIKGKISLIPMETILIILKELEYLQSLVKLVRRRMLKYTKTK
jgi:hypothetical protein